MRINQDQGLPFLKLSHGRVKNNELNDELKFYKQKN